MRILLPILILPLLADAQTSFKGRVIDRNTNNGIPYATVALVKENTGINADEQGNFFLVSSNKKLHDSLIISSVGYQPIIIPVDKPYLFDSIKLEKRNVSLKEVIVTTKTQWTFDTLHDLASSEMYLETIGFQVQVAQPFRVEVSNTILSGIKIYRKSHFLNPERTMFRIRIYNRDSISKAPSEELCNEVIEVKSKSEVVTLNLDSYHIHIPNRDFFIAIEWLKIPYNAFKFKFRQNGKVSEEIRYRPSIGMTQGELKDFGPWSLDYNNIWRPMFPNENSPRGVSISATIKY